jgi:hypothetical protein
VGEYLQKWSVTLAVFGRCEQSGYNLATIRPTIQLIIAIKQGLICYCYLGIYRALACIVSILNLSLYHSSSVTCCQSWWLFMSPTFLFIPYIWSHSITLASIPVVSLVVPYRLLVGPSERLLANFYSLHCSLLLVYFQGLGSIYSINAQLLGLEVTMILFLSKQFSTRMMPWLWGEMQFHRVCGMTTSKGFGEAWCWHRDW